MWLTNFFCISCHCVRTITIECQQVKKRAKRNNSTIESRCRKIGSDYRTSVSFKPVCLRILSSPVYPRGLVIPTINRLCDCLSLLCRFISLSLHLSCLSISHESFCQIRKQRGSSAIATSVERQIDRQTARQKRRWTVHSELHLSTYRNCRLFYQSIHSFAHSLDPFSLLSVTLYFSSFLSFHLGLSGTFLCSHSVSLFSFRFKR